MNGMIDGLKRFEIEPNKLSLEKVVSLDFDKDSNDKYDHIIEFIILIRVSNIL